MAARRYLQLDVFAARAGSGNPLGVVLDAVGMDTADMQALAAWLNLSETVFFLPVEDAAADYRIRIFTPGSELPFAGHPSVGAAWAALDTGLVAADADTLVQACGAGLLPVRVATTPAGQRTIELRTPRMQVLDPPLVAIPDNLQALAASGVSPVLWSNGPAWWLLRATSAEAVRGFVPDFAAIAAFSNATAATGLAIFAPEAGEGHDVVVRAFCPGDAVNVPEDPVTGSANALIAAWLAAHDALPHADGRYVASQGRELGRDGRVQLRIDADGDVWLGGEVQPVIRGNLDW
jgi:PhzF family phenazine biosynthesis protein